jgi:peptidoglycan/LPS O-acetylase OafA/YrhL
MGAPPVESAPVLQPPRALVSSRLKSIDLLRGCAALFVVVHHAFEHDFAFSSNPLWYRFLRAFAAQGYLGVPLFFVISGFCIHLQYARSVVSGQKTSVGFVSFWKRRLHRLYPPYFAALCASMLIVVAAYLAGVHSGLLELYPLPRGRWMVFDFLAHLTMLHGVIPSLDQMGGNAAFWTLAREEYLYLLYFFVLAWRKRWGIQVAMALVLFSGFAFHFVFLPFVPGSSRWWYIIDTSAIVLWIQWCLGMVAVEAYYGIIKLPWWLSQLWIAALVAPLAKLSETYRHEVSPALWALTFFMVVNYCVRKESTGRLPASGIFVWLAAVGVFSYSLYLIHGPLQQVMYGVLTRSHITVTLAVSVLFALLTIVASYYGARVFFYLVERRFLNPRTRVAVAASRTV